jgi:periplasmic protein CpxP/Spy
MEPVMKTLLATVAVATAFIACAEAQTTTQPMTTPPSTSAAPSTTTQAPAAQPPMVEKTDAGAPLPGANSFTEAQVRSRIEQQGYTNVTGLAKDADGIWRGKASKDGKSQEVAVDFRGNIVVSQN